MSASSTPLLRVEALTKHFPVQKDFFDRLTLRRGRLRLLQQRIHAVNGVSLTIGRGETLALVGESGCGEVHLGQDYRGSASAHGGPRVL
jgi:ABC-type oligopeptide transport system ATPase subunit